MRKEGLIFLLFRLVHKDDSVIFENSTQPATKDRLEYGSYEIRIMPLSIFILTTEVANFFYILNAYTDTVSLSFV